MSFYLMPRVAANVPALGASTAGFTWNADLGIETHAMAMTGNGLIALTGRLRLAHLVGSDNYLSSISGNDESLSYGQFQVGVLLKQAISIQAGIPFNLRRQNSLLQTVPPGISVGFAF
jgi:hypothetical protein